MTIKIQELNKYDYVKLDKFFFALDEKTKFLWTHYKNVDEVYAEKAYKIVAFIGDEIKALAYVIPNNEYPDTPALGVVILDGYRELGIGTKMMVKLEEWARQHNFRNLFLTTYIENTVAKTFYEKLGYKVIGIVKRNERDSYAMKKCIIGKTVITGGSGFIGTQLVLNLPKDNLVILDVKPPMNELKENWIYCDITDSYSVYEGCEGAKQIYHLAANPIPSLAEKNPAFDLHLNVIGTLNVINACLKNNAKMVFSSSGMVNRGGNYGVSKRSAELYIQNYVSKYGLKASIVRFENIYGPTQPLGFVIPDFIAKLNENRFTLEVRGTGRDLREFVFIDDAVDALKIVMEKGKIGEIYSIGSGEVVTMFELANLINETLGLNAEIKIRNPIVTNVEQNKNSVDITKILELGWKPKFTLMDGLKKCIKNK